MSFRASLTTLGDWNRGVDVGLRDVLFASMDLVGRTGEEACKHALILMAQSAAAMTPKAPARRKVVANTRYIHLLRGEEPGSTYKEARMAGRDMSRYFLFTAVKPYTAAGPINLYANDPSRISKIGNRGLAKRSWLWGLGALGLKNEGRVLNGASRVFAVTSQHSNGYVKENRLSYVSSIMPAGWETTVAQRAQNKIMGQARAKIEREFATRIARRDRAVGRSVASFFTGPR